MRTHTFSHLVFTLLLIAGLAPVVRVNCQGCRLLPPVIHIDFGSGSNVSEYNATAHPNYQMVRENCPPDGFYTYTNYTSNCFHNDWFTLRDDHTGGGNMMLVNASERGGSFFSSVLPGLKDNTQYELAVWLMNVCRINGGCDPLPPNIHIAVVTFTGKKVAEFVTGQLTQTSAPAWKKYSAMFTVPPGETMLGLLMSNLTTGGCGNDFAMDDITVRECEEEKPQPLEPPAPEPVIAKVEKKPQAKTQTPSQTVPAPVQKKIPTMEKQETGVEKEQAPLGNTNPGIIDATAPVLVPAVLRTRENPVVKTIKTAAGELQVDIYDNGQIDGDTISVYHNNQLLLSRAGLSQSPISFKIPVNARQPHHEIVMVAENLGSIPPNTSIMILKVNGRRYDVFISSTEQKNAKIVVDLAD